MCEWFLLTTFAGAVRDVQTALRPTLEKFGAASVNFITDPYVANHRGLDLMLDLASIRTTSTGAVVMQDRKSSLGEQCPLGQFASGSYDFITTPLPTVGTLYVMPTAATASAGGTVQFNAFIVGSPSREFSWSEYLREGVSLGSRPELVGGGLIRSAGGWSQVKSRFRKGEEERFDERILGSGEFVETTVAEAEEKIRRQFPVSSVM